MSAKITETEPVPPSTQSSKEGTQMIKHFNIVGLVLDDCPRIKTRSLPARVEVSEYCEVCPRQCGIDYEKMEIACGRPAVPSLASFDASLVDTPGAEVASSVVNV